MMMKKISLTLDGDDLEEIVRSHLAVQFPEMEMETVTIPYLSPITLRLKRKEPLPAPAPATEEG